MSLHVDMVDMRLLVAVAQSNSVTKGAEACHMSTPAASTRIKHLEQSIGTRLFHRTHLGVTLTPSGQAFVLHARQVLAQVERLRTELQEYAHGIKGHLRVFANTTALGEFLPPVLRTFLQTHPDVSIDLRERSSHDIVRAVGDGQTDVGIVAGTVRTEDLQVIPYRSDRLVLVVPRGHGLARRRQVAFADTLDLDYIGLHESSAIHGFLQQISSGLDRGIKLRIQVGNFEAACRMIEAKIGVGVMPRSAASRHALTMAIGIVALSDDWALREMKICVRALMELPAFARDLVDLLVDDARKAAPA